MQCFSGVIDLGGGVGEGGGGIRKVLRGGEGGGVGDGLLEQGFGLAGAVEAEESFGSGG